MHDQEAHKVIVNYLRNYQPLFIGLFGSFVRGEQNEDSDIDILVKFKETLSLLEIVRIENELSELLGRKVDLVTDGAIKNQRIRRSIERDLQTIYEA
ncbi:MAG: nucleotidyltransferase family protein [Bacteroidales bacterium]